MSEDKDDASRLAELEADNRRLRRLLEQKDAPGELRHRLRSTMALLRSIIRRSAETERDLDAYVGHLEDRMDALMRAQLAADEHGTIDLHRTLAEELLYYGVSEGGRVTLSGPELELSPRAGQVLALAIHELAVNAVEHGALGNGSGHVRVAWTLDDEASGPILTLTWSEQNNMRVSSTAAVHRGFGTGLLVDTLGYELQASTTLDFDGGARCVIRFPFPTQVGQLRQSANPNDIE